MQQSRAIPALTDFQRRFPARRISEVALPSVLRNVRAGHRLPSSSTVRSVHRFTARSTAAELAEACLLELIFHPEKGDDHDLLDHAIDFHFGDDARGAEQDSGAGAFVGDASFRY